MAKDQFARDIPDSMAMTGPGGSAGPVPSVNEPQIGGPNMASFAKQAMKYHQGKSATHNKQADIHENIAKLHMKMAEHHRAHSDHHAKVADGFGKGDGY